MTANSFKPVRWLTLAGIVVFVGVLTLGTSVLMLGREDAWRQARQNLDNLSLSLEREIIRNISILDLSIQGAQAALRLPGIENVSPEIRHAALFDAAASAEYLGSVLIVDKNGWMSGNSTSLQPPRLSLADRDYFTVHQASSSAGLYLSQPFRSRLRSNDPSIAISRRMSTADGQFNGIVAGTLRLAYFDALFDHLNLGKDGVVAVFRTDGQLIARMPRRSDEIDRILGPNAQASKVLLPGQREMIATSEIDGIERLTIFRSVAGFPVVLAVGASTETIMAPWRHRSIAIAATLVVLSIAACLLGWLLSRELRSRMQAEQKALSLAKQLSVLATTDALTGLANRRAFNERLGREWRRSARSETSIAALMIDADKFKLFNDRHGHLEGDRILRAIAECLPRWARRAADLCARFGGEEFVVLLPETELAGATSIAEAIRSEIAGLAMPHIDSPIGVVSVSIGVAALYPTQDGASSELIKQADAALYAAKHAGRNTVMTMPPEVARFDGQIHYTG